MPLLNPQFRTGPGRIRRALAVVACLALWVSAVGSQEPTDNQIKAAFLYKFGYFVSWPEGHFADENAPLVIGVLGKDPFGPDLDAITKGKEINGRPVRVARFKGLDDLAPCAILFVSPALREKDLERALLWAAGVQALTVGEGEAFAHRGGAIGFFLQKNKVRFAVNRQVADRSGLTISSRLLRVALLVEDIEEEE